MNLSLRFLADLAERVLKTFVQAYAGFWVVAGPEFDTLFTLNGLKVATAAAAFAVATAVISKPVGNPDSASVLPPAAQPPAPKPADPTLEPQEAAPTPRAEENASHVDNLHLWEIGKRALASPAEEPQPRAIDPTLLSAGQMTAMAAPQPGLTPQQLATLADLVRTIQPVATPAPAAPAPTLPPAPVARPLGLLDPTLVGGRDPNSEGNQ